ncbi:MAG: ribosome silencing factor [Nitrospirota bacterium]|nr:MAG: ribosome silencing factor [Nitrospirota bacterium]
MLKSLEKARLIAKASQDKKSVDPVIIEIKDLTVIADYFVVCSGESKTQVGAISDHINEELRKSGIKPRTVEGADFNNWVLLDYGDVIAHVFDAETRSFYELEKLWLDAPRISIK